MIEFTGCHECDRTGVFAPKDSPDEVCTCVDRWVKRVIAEGDVADLDSPSRPHDDGALLDEFRETLPGDADWMDRDHLNIPALGDVYFESDTPLQTVREVARVLVALRNGKTDKSLN